MNYVVESTLYLVVPWLVTYMAVIGYRRRARQRSRR